MRLYIRHYLAAAFVLAAVIPIIGFGLWMRDNATERAFASVAEKHLLVAKTIGLGMQHYATDIEAVFQLFAESEGRIDAPAALGNLAGALGFRYFAVVENNRVSAVIRGTDESFEGLPAQTFTKLRLGPDRSPITFQDVSQDEKGRPAIYVTQSLGGGKYAIANIGVTFLQELQREVEFGSRGHAAIVDGAGTLIAHPREEWVLRNIASLAPVQEMLAGNSGTMQFYSPAVEKDMVVGYTTIPGLGWGVMVPQPIDEVMAHTEQVTRVAVAFMVVGIIVAALLAWALSDVFSGPVTRLIDEVLDHVEGRPGGRGPALSRYAPREYRQLNSGFKLMAELARPTDRSPAGEAMRTYFLGGSRADNPGTSWRDTNDLGQALLTDWMVKPYTVLYAEESAEKHDLAEVLLNQILPKCEVISAFTGAETVEIARNVQPDLIILALDLPDLNGYAILQFLREFDETSGVPVIATHRNLNSVVTQQLLESGFDGVLQKPVGAAELFGIVEKFLKRVN